MSLCAVGGDPVRDLKLGDGADAAAGAAVGQDGAAARQLRSFASPSARMERSAFRVNARFSREAAVGRAPRTALPSRPTRARGSPASALASILALTLSYCNRYLQLSQYERRRRSNAFGFLA